MSRLLLAVACLPLFSQTLPHDADSPLRRSSSSPQLRSRDGEWKFLGNLNANRFDPDSVSNPSGRYGSRFSPDSINNPFGRYGSPFSPESANYPYGASAPPLPVTPLRVRPLPSLVPHSQR
jgi:hypothetical protein